jgi:hypothetical protein
MLIQLQELSQDLQVNNVKHMIQNIDIESIVTILKVLPKKHHTNNIKVAKGKYKLPTTFKQLIKKISNG